MSHNVLPLDCRGSGRLLGATARGALALHRRFRGGEWAPFNLVLFPAPDLNIVCFAVGHPSLRSLEETNAFADRIYAAMSVGEERPARQLDYFVTKTVCVPSSTVAPRCRWSTPLASRPRKTSTRAG